MTDKKESGLYHVSYKGDKEEVKPIHGLVFDYDELDQKLAQLDIHQRVSLLEFLTGIRDVKEKDIIKPVKDNLFDLSEDEIEAKHVAHLPETLHSAIEEFKKSELMREVLGEHLFNTSIDAKEKEWKEYHTTVSEFELRKYLGR